MYYKYDILFVINKNEVKLIDIDQKTGEIVGSNKIFSKENIIKLKDYWSLLSRDFYLNAKPDFVENFEVPEHILEIDKEHLIDQTINKIKNTPTTLIGENAVKAVKTREEEREIKNRERYNKAFSKTKQSDEVKFYTPEELFEDAFSTTKTNINYTVETNRETNPEILSQVITDKINSYRKSIQNLENAFWGIKKNKDGTLSEPSQDNIDIPFIATLSKESLYQLLVLANHLLKGYLYGKTSNQVQYEIYEMLNSFDINLIYGSNSQVCGIAFEGLVFTLPENKEKEDIKNKSLAIDYNTDDFSDNTALLLGTNGFTYNRSSIPFNLKKYIRNFKQQSKYKELQDIDFARQLFEEIQQLNSSQNNENYIFRDAQISEFIYKIGQQQKICS